MIYFAQSTTTGAIKIGCSVNVEQRVRELERQFQEPLCLLHVMDGDRDTEREIHLRFAHLRLEDGMEQFQPGLDLMAFIGLPVLVHANPDAVQSVGPKVKYPPNCPRDYKVIGIDAGVMHQARIVCAYRRKSLTTYVSELLRPIVARDLAQEQAQAMKGPAAPARGPIPGQGSFLEPGKGRKGGIR